MKARMKTEIPPFSFSFQNNSHRLKVVPLSSSLPPLPDVSVLCDHSFDETKWTRQLPQFQYPTCRGSSGEMLKCWSSTHLRICGVSSHGPKEESSPPLTSRMGYSFIFTSFSHSALQGKWSDAVLKSRERKIISEQLVPVALKLSAWMG